MVWREAEVSDELVNRLTRKLSIDAVLASHLVQLGFSEPDEAFAFLHPRLRGLDDPFEITHLEPAVRRLNRAMAEGQEILIFGDYDVDGVTSTVLLVSILKRYGIYPRYIVPRRLEEGYGLTQAALDRALEKGLPGLLIALDCGTNSVAEVKGLRERGIDVIIIDHHRAREGIPRDCILVNPHIFDQDRQSWRSLCTVGLVFKLVHGLLKMLRQAGDELAFKIQLKDYLDLVALGTIADLVPLQHENRILAKAGLLGLAKTRRPGLTALFEVCGIHLGNEVTPFDISFRLGPRINASGRLSDAVLPIEMLLGKDGRLCHEQARHLNQLNSERQELDRHMFEDAEKIIGRQTHERAGFVLFEASWHPGVVGIVASRITQKYNRPCIVLGKESDLARGSGRSITGVNLVEILKSSSELLDSWGGHPMAVGVSLKVENIEPFREAFHQAILGRLKGNFPKKEIVISNWISRTSIPSAFELIDPLYPFGQNNPEPIFGIRSTILAHPPELFGHDHFRFKLEVDKTKAIPCVAWKLADHLPPTQHSIDLAVKLGWNNWKGRKCQQATLVDWRRSNSN